MKKQLIRMLYILTALTLSTARAQTNGNALFLTDAQGCPQYYSGQLTVKLKTPLPPSGLAKNATAMGRPSLDRTLARHRLIRLEKRFRHRPIPAASTLPDLSRIYRLTFPDDVDVLALADSLNRDPHVEYAEPVPVHRLFHVPNDSLYASLYHLRQIMAERAWEIHRGEDGERTVRIGVVDTGVDWQHPDLAENIWQNPGEDIDGDGRTLEWDGQSWIFDPGDENGLDDDGNGYVDDFIGWNFCADHDYSGAQSNNPQDPGYHGTHVAGIAAGVTGNGKGIASISYNVALMSTSHAVDYYGDYYILHGWDGIIYLAENGADIINCSFGGGGSQAEAEAAEYAWGLGSIIVAAAGNGGSDRPNYPAAFPHVLSVGNVDSLDQAWYSTNRGASVHVCAPGVAINSTAPGGQYRMLTGTSMSSPLVAGLLGLIKSQHPEWDNTRLITQLLATADPIDALNPGLENQLGAGRINAFRALTEQAPTLPAQYHVQWGSDVYFTGDDGSPLPNIGGRGRFALSMRNFGFYAGHQDVRLSLSTDDTEIRILNSEAAVSLKANDISHWTALFEIEVADRAHAHEVAFTVTVDSDMPIHGERQMQFKMLVAPSGLLVWEPYATTSGSSAGFIRDFLTAQHLPVYYTQTLPPSFQAFDAVFLTRWGYGQHAAAEIMTDYLKSGGRLYLEGWTPLSGMAADDTLCHLLGIAQYAPSKEAHFPGVLTGQDSSLAQGMRFEGVASSQALSMDVLHAAPQGRAVLQEEALGTLAVAARGDSGQETYCSTVPLASLVENGSTAGRRRLLAGILTAFGYNIALCADFSVAPKGPDEPESYQFYDLSCTEPSRPVTAWAWDFDSDGVIDARTPHPVYTYDAPGHYDVSLTVSDGQATAHRLLENAVYVPEHGTALLPAAGNGAVMVAGDTLLDLRHAFTIGCRVRLDSILAAAYAGSYWPFLKKSDGFTFALTRSGDMDLEFKMADGSWQWLYTETEPFTKNTWHHLAATFDGDSATCSLYLDGVVQAVYTHDTPFTNLNREPGNLRLAFGLGFPGAIDDVQLWERCLSAGEVMENTETTITGSETGLAAWWPLSEGCGQITADATGHGNQGIVVNMNWDEGAALETTAVDPATLPAANPDEFSLSQNYPNPFNPSTVIGYTLPEKTHVEITVYDILGRRVKTLVDDVKTAGTQTAVWEGRDHRGRSVGAGVYCCVIRAGAFHAAQKMILLK